MRTCGFLFGRGAHQMRGSTLRPNEGESVRLRGLARHGARPMPSPLTTRCRLLAPLQLGRNQSDFRSGADEPQQAARS